MTSQSMNRVFEIREAEMADPMVMACPRSELENYECRTSTSSVL
jgi:hypothetical protein